jgi:hypothetical protein
MKTKTKRFAICAAALVVCGFAFAQPSEYYLWQNKKTAAKLCDPQAPNDDWVQLSGPYEDPSCSNLIKQ